MLRRLCLIALACAAVLTPSACSKSKPASSTPSHKRASITIGITQEPDTLWMPMKQMNASEHVGRPGGVQLTVIDDQHHLRAWAAREIPTLANHGVELLPDGAMRVTWHLRDDMMWADGKPVTADDFVFTYELSKDPNLEIVDRTVIDRIRSMKAVDATTFVVEYTEPYAYYAQLRVHEVLPKHIVEPLWKAKGRALKEDPFGTKPVLGGAFTIAEWIPGTSITAVKNPYAKGFWQPKLDAITWKIIPDTTTLEANLLSGSIDAISVIGLTFDQALDLQKRLPPQFEMRFTDAFNFEHIELNTENPILADVKVREALLVALDREKLVQQLFEGKQPVAWCAASPRSPFFDETAPKHPFDPQRAASLLDEAGWKLGPDGVRVKDGKPLRIPLMTTAGDKTRELVEEVLVSQWKKVGVDVVVQNQPAKIMFGDTIRHRKFEGMAMFTWTQDPFQINESWYRCDQIPRENNAWKGMNYSGSCDPAIDALFAQMTRELDDDKRAALGKQVIHKLAEDLPVLPLYFREDVSVVPRGFIGWRPPGVLESMAWNAQEWAYP